MRKSGALYRHLSRTAWWISLSNATNVHKPKTGYYTLHYHGIFLQGVLQSLHHQPFCVRVVLSLEIYVRRINNYDWSVFILHPEINWTRILFWHKFCWFLTDILWHSCLRLSKYFDLKSPNLTWWRISQGLDRCTNSLPLRVSVFESTNSSVIDA